MDSPTPFARLGKEAATSPKGFFQRTIDNAWNSTVKPLQQGYQRARQGLGRALDGASQMVSHGVSSPVPAAFSGFRKGWGDGGGLGGAVQGGVDALNKQTRADMSRVGKGWNNLTGGVSDYFRAMPQSLGNMGRGNAAAASGPSQHPITPSSASSSTWADSASNAYSASTPPAPQPTPAAPPTPQLSSVAYGPQPQPATPSPAVAAMSPPPMPPDPTEETPDARYLADVMGSFDPNSALDRAKAEAINRIWQQSGGEVSPNQVYSDPRYAAINIGNYQQHDPGELEWMKSANTAGLVRAGQKGLQALGGALRRSGAKARAAAPKDISHVPLRTGEVPATRALIPHPNPGAKLPKAPHTPGDRRMVAGNAFKSLSKGMGNLSPTQQGLINYGLPVGLAASALGGLGARGAESRGYDRGVGDGYDVGGRAGISAALANQPQDPGFLGRLLGLFTGYADGPAPAELQDLLAQNKTEALRTIMRGTA